MEKDREKKCNKYNNFKQESDKKTILKIFISKSYNEIHSYSKKKSTNLSLSCHDLSNP